MANITVNVGDIYTRSTRMKQIGEELINSMNEVVNAANNVSTGWTGVNSQAYVDAFNNFKPKILQKCNAIFATSNGLGITADKISELQQQTSAKISNLGGGTSTSGATATGGSQVTSQTPASQSGSVTPGEITHSSFVDDVRNFDIENYKQGETFQATSYGQDYTDEQIFELAAIVGGEDCGSYEGALAVASTMCNRADAGNWGGGQDILSIAKAPNQFVAYAPGQGTLYDKFMTNPSSLPDYVIQATKDALAGTRNTTADSFRSGPGNGGRYQIGDGGNYYFRV